jgi:hypothetical protein
MGLFSYRTNNASFDVKFVKRAQGALGTLSSGNYQVTISGISKARAKDVLLSSLAAGWRYSLPVFEIEPDDSQHINPGLCRRNRHPDSSSESLNKRTVLTADCRLLTGHCFQVLRSCVANNASRIPVQIMRLHVIISKISVV